MLAACIYAIKKQKSYFGQWNVYVEIVLVTAFNRDELRLGRCTPWSITDVTLHFHPQLSYFLIIFEIIYTFGITNECSTRQIQSASLHPKCVSTLAGKTINNTKTADDLIQCVLSNRLFVPLQKVV